MTPLACGQCGAEVPEGATACPQCGAPRPAATRPAAAGTRPAAVLLGLGLVALLAAALTPVVGQGSVTATGDCERGAPPPPRSQDRWKPVLIGVPVRAALLA